MPIVKKKPSQPTQPPPPIPRVEAPAAKTVIVDTKYTPRSSLLKYIEGQTWTVNYYARYRHKDDVTYAHDPEQSVIYQQYKKIEKLQFKVESALSTQQDQDSKGFVVRGSAILPLSVIPNEGDMFTADVGDGREGVFQIENSEKRSIYKESAYFIEYVMLFFSDSDPVRRADLESKVVSNYHYIPEFTQYGQNAIVTTERYKTYTEIAFHYKRLKNAYFDWFFSREYSTLILPGQTLPTYDSHIVKVIRSLYQTNDVYEYKLMRALNIEDDDLLKRPTLWDALLNRDIHILDIAEKKAGLVTTKSFSSDPMTETIYYSGIQRIVYPKTSHPRLDHHNNQLQKTLLPVELESVPTLNGNTVPLLKDNTVEHLNKQMTIIESVLKDDYYVLSQAFYENEHPKSLLEVLTENYLQKEANSPELVLKLILNVWKWGGLERFYYAPILMILASNIIKDL